MFLFELHLRRLAALCACVSRQSKGKCERQRNHSFHSPRSLLFSFLPSFVELRVVLLNGQDAGLMV
jgi:hypothetical protein